MSKNKLFYGDNLDIMRQKLKDASVDLCYIDPPFNSKRNYNQIYNRIGKEDLAQAEAFVDTWTWDDLAIAGFQEIIDNARGRFTKQTVELIKGLQQVLGGDSLLAYLVSITLRVTEIQRILTQTGSFYLHCDPTASHYLKLILDAVFVPRGGLYRNEIVWQRTNAHNFKGKRFARIHDILLYYTKSRKFVWNQLYTEYSEEQLSRYKPDEAGRLYKAENLTMSGGNRNFEWRGSQPPPHRSWGYDKDDLERLWAEGRILTKKDGTPRLDGWKIYLDEMQGKPLSDIWTDIGRLGNTTGDRLGYPTQKPDDLLERIIRASSPEGGSVLDAYCGCGTTIAVAERLRRSWIGIDITYQSISVVLFRLERAFRDSFKQILANIVLDGVPRDMESARALALKQDDRVRKEFEKWAVLTYTNNRAIINTKKGADKGIDGIAYFQTGKVDNAKIVLQAKSGHVDRSKIATLRGDMQRENAEMGIFITLEEPTKPMQVEANEAGHYHHPQMQKNYPRIQIVTVKDIIENGDRLNIPMSLEVLRAAQAAKTDRQLNVFDESPPGVAALQIDQGEVDEN